MNSIWLIIVCFAFPVRAGRMTMPEPEANQTNSDQLNPSDPAAVAALEEAESDIEAGRLVDLS